jgi:hypothetical protein
VGPRVSPRNLVFKEDVLKYPNLVWAINDRRLACYELAAKISVERTKLSRCMNGLVEFSPTEREKIAEALGYPLQWLFQTPMPPQREEFKAPLHAHA